MQLKSQPLLRQVTIIAAAADLRYELKEHRLSEPHVVQTRRMAVYSIMTDKCASDCSLSSLSSH